MITPSVRPLSKHFALSSADRPDLSSGMLQEEGLPLDGSSDTPTQLRFFICRYFKEE